MKPTPGRGHPGEEYTILRINPYPYERVAGQKEGVQTVSRRARVRAARWRVASTTWPKSAYTSTCSTTTPHGRLPTWTSRASTST